MDHTGVGGSCREGVGNTGVGWVMLGWGGSCRDGVCHAGVGWGGDGVCMQGWGGIGHAVVGSGGSYRGGMGWVMKNIKILKILNCWCYRVSNPAKTSDR